MAVDFSFSEDEEKEEKRQPKPSRPEKKPETFVSPEEYVEPTEEEPTVPAPMPGRSEPAGRKCILCGAELKSDLGFMCNDCRDRLLARTRLGPMPDEKKGKTKTIKF